MYENNNYGKLIYTVLIRGFRQAKRFKEEIGFRVSHRRKRLEFLLSIENLSQKERYKKWK